MKDTNNLLPYNVWSGSEYSKNISGYYAISSTAWSIIGEYSFRNDHSKNWLTLYQDTSLNNVSLTLTANINSETGGSLCIYYMVNGSYSVFKSGFNKYTVGLISVSADIPSEATLVWCRVDLTDSSKTIFIDNVTLFINQ